MAQGPTTTAPSGTDPRLRPELILIVGGLIASGHAAVMITIAALPLYHAKLRAKGLKSAAAQMAHVWNKMFTTLEGKGVLRTAPEEFLLAAEYNPHDELAAAGVRMRMPIGAPPPARPSRCSE